MDGAQSAVNFLAASIYTAFIRTTCTPTALKTRRPAGYGHCGAHVSCASILVITDATACLFVSYCVRR